MRTFFLFYLLSSLLQSPLLALLIVGAVLYATEARMSGRYFNPATFISNRSHVHELQQKLAVNPHDVSAHNDLGRLLVGKGRHAEALPHMQAAAERMSESAETNYYLGLSLLETGHSGEGVERIRRALEINPRFSYGDPSLALARHYLAGGDAERSAEAAAACVALNTSSVEGWWTLGEARRSLGEKSEASEAFRHAVDAFDHLPHYLRLANRHWAKLARRAAKTMNHT